MVRGCSLGVRRTGSGYQTSFALLGGQRERHWTLVYGEVELAPAVWKTARTRRHRCARARHDPPARAVARAAPGVASYDDRRRRRSRARGGRPRPATATPRGPHPPRPPQARPLDEPADGHPRAPRDSRRQQLARHRRPTGRRSASPTSTAPTDACRWPVRRGVLAACGAVRRARHCVTCVVLALATLLAARRARAARPPLAARRRAVARFRRASGVAQVDRRRSRSPTVRRSRAGDPRYGTCAGERLFAVVGGDLARRSRHPQNRNVLSHRDGEPALFAAACLLA